MYRVQKYRSIRATTCRVLAKSVRISYVGTLYGVCEGKPFVKLSPLFFFLYFAGELSLFLFLTSNF